MEDRGLAAKHSPEENMKLIITLLTIIGLSVTSIYSFQEKHAAEQAKEHAASQGALNNLMTERNRLKQLLNTKPPNDPACAFIENQLENNLIFVNRQRAEMGKPPEWE